MLPFNARRRSQGEERSSEQRPPRPWRTEGLPQGQPPNRRPRWIEIVTFVLSYALFFGLLTVQDRMGGPQSIPYTEFKAQVANKNVREVFARGNTIQGALRKTDLSMCNAVSGATRSALGPQRAFGQFWAMRDGSPERYGTPGNEESVSCRFQVPIVGSNPTLTAKSFIVKDLLTCINCT